MGDAPMKEGVLPWTTKIRKLLAARSSSPREGANSRYSDPGCDVTGIGLHPKSAAKATPHQIGPMRRSSEGPFSGAWSICRLVASNCMRDVEFGRRRNCLSGLLLQTAFLLVPCGLEQCAPAKWHGRGLQRRISVIAKPFAIFPNLTFRRKHGLGDVPLLSHSFLFLLQILIECRNRSVEKCRHMGPPI